MRSRLAAASRDQEPSAFARVLETLLQWSPTLEGAALVDSDGEAVDYAGALPAFTVKVAAAHCQLFWSEAATRLGRFGLIPTRLLVRCRSWGLAVLPLADRYALVMLLRRRAFDISERALRHAERELFREAGWPAPAWPRPMWVPVRVEATPGRGRPLRVAMGDEDTGDGRDENWSAVEVLGTWTDRARRERGFRVRISSGAELMLVREALGRWFADEPLQAFGDPTLPPAAPVQSGSATGPLPPLVGRGPSLPPAPAHSRSFTPPKFTSKKPGGA